jgi:hypothetical protein
VILPRATAFAATSFFAATAALIDPRAVQTAAKSFVAPNCAMFAALNCAVAVNCRATVNVAL